MGELINGRTPEEIKTALKVCPEDIKDCPECPYELSFTCRDTAMLDALALIERKEVERDALKRALDEALELNKQQAEIIRRLEAKAPKWISVEERLPEGECLALGWQNEMLIGYVGRSGGGYACESDGEYLIDVTHWMPLPEPPEEDE